MPEPKKGWRWPGKAVCQGCGTVYSAIKGHGCAVTPDEVVALYIKRGGWLPDPK